MFSKLPSYILPIYLNISNFGHDNRFNRLIHFTGFHLGYLIDNIHTLDDPGETAQSRWEAWKPWIEAVTGHHGHIKWSEYISNYDFSPTSDKRLKEIDRKARKAWFSTIESLFLHPVGLSLDHNPPPISPLLAGFCSVSDWLGSRSDDENFRFYSQSEDLNNYFERSRAEDAKRVMDLSGIISRPRQYDGIKALLKPEYEPRPLQILMERLPCLFNMMAA